MILARLFIGLPYIKSDIFRKRNFYRSENPNRHLRLEATYTPKQCIDSVSSLEYWLTERHALYKQNGKNLYRIDIHHKPWPLQLVKIDSKISGYPLIGTPMVASPDLAHYAKELKVLVWGQKNI